MTIDEYLYRVSLEPEGTWFLSLGTAVEAAPPYLNIGALSAFVAGYTAAAHQGPATLSSDFFLWLRDEAGAFPPEGWARAFLREADGDHAAAIGRLFWYLHRFALETRPGWFVAFNQAPQPGLTRDGLGRPFVADTRLRDHVEAARGRPGVAVFLSAFELTHRSWVPLGLPPDVASWSLADGTRRVVVAGTPARLERMHSNEWSREARLPAGACIVDVSRRRVEVRASKTGAVLVRSGRIIRMSSPGAPADWPIRSTDRLLVLSAVLFERARSLARKRLPPSLATAAPIAWAQSVKSKSRRLAVLIEFGVPSPRS